MQVADGGDGTRKSTCAAAAGRAVAAWNRATTATRAVYRGELASRKRSWTSDVYIICACMF